MMLKTLSKLFVVAVLMSSKMALAAGACSDCQTVDFGKKIELRLIEPMLTMTIPEKLAYMQSFGVELYKVADPLKGAPTVAVLPEATTKQFSKKFIDLFEDSVLGIYMTPTNSMYRVSKPTILLVESADDWTLIHEFTHYMFDRARTQMNGAKEGVLVNNSADAQEDFFDAREKYRNLDGYVSEEHKQHTIMSFINYANLQMTFAKTCEFEETTIEKLLRAAYETRKPVGFLPPHFERSTRYIRSTSAKGQQNLDFLLQDCEELPKTLTEKDVDLKKDLAKTCAKVQKLKQADLDVLQGLGIQLSP